ncbi:hypothetical protein NC651_011141 [Populus alba x Populus x berolinensis]|nr:hypothetical protein NC651_011141 [Populus alba x Populus x berolinensis]
MAKKASNPRNVTLLLLLPLASSTASKSPMRSQRGLHGNREWLGSENERRTKSKTKKNKKFDAKKPKKPPTAFFYFLEDFRKEFQEQNPDVKSMREWFIGAVDHNPFAS